MRNMSEGDIGLSVQGQYFIVKRATIALIDWILSKILSSEISWEKTSDNGLIYLDIDPSSFLLFSMPHSRSRPDLVLLKATARYLLLDKIHSQIAIMYDGIAEEVPKKDEELYSFRRMGHTARRLEEKLAKGDDFKMTVAQCQSLSTRAGTSGHPGAFDYQIPCGSCGNYCSRLFGTKHQTKRRKKGNKRNLQHVQTVRHLPDEAVSGQF